MKKLQTQKPSEHLQEVIHDLYEATSFIWADHVKEDIEHNIKELEPLLEYLKESGQ